MDYFAEVRGLHDYMQSNKLSTGQIVLWYELMHLNNKSGWKDWFTATNLTLELYTGLSRSGIEKNRNVLKQKGLIDFKSNGTKATSYHMETLQIDYTMLNSTQDSTQERLQSSIQRCTQNSLQNSGTLNNNTIQDKTRQSDRAREVLNYYRERTGLDVSDGSDKLAEIDELIADNVDHTLITALIDYAVDHKKTSVWRYAMSAVRGNVAAGIKTLASYRANEGKRRPEPARENAAAYDTSFQDRMRAEWGN